MSGSVALRQTSTRVLPHVVSCTAHSSVSTTYPKLLILVLTDGDNQGPEAAEKVPHHELVLGNSLKVLRLGFFRSCIHSQLRLESLLRETHCALRSKDGTARTSSSMASLLASALASSA